VLKVRRQSPPAGGTPGYAGHTDWSPFLLAHTHKEPSRRLRFGGIAAVVAVLAALAAVPAHAASLHVVFPQSAEVTVVQGQSTSFAMEVQAFGATSCDATTAPVRVNTLFSVDAVGDVAQGLPADMPITTSDNRGVSDNCSIQNPVLIPLTATAAAGTPVGDYTTVIRYGKGGDGGVDLDGPALTIHVVPPQAQVLPPSQLAPPPEIILLPERTVAPHPTLGETVLLTLVKGKVSFREPGGEWTVLGGPTVVRNSTVVDATNGVVKVTVERDRSHHLDSADVWGGSFKVHQDSGKRPVTTFTLTGDISSARTVARSAAFVRVRKLWVNGKGNFKTRGRRASAIVRGTYWLTEDTDAGTTVRVNRGLVAVRDFVKKRTVLVSTGHSYTARPRAPRRVPAFTGSVRRH
jgi:hypothetical protein